MPQKYLFADIETTGLNPEKDEILSLAVVDEKGKIVLNHLFRPEKNKAWPEAQEIHGISPHMVKSAPTFLKIKAEIFSVLTQTSTTTVFYNAHYDSAFFRRHMTDKENNRWQVDCAMKRFFGIACALGHIPKKGKEHYFSLHAALQIAGQKFTGKGAHDALSDAIACFLVWQWCDSNDPRENKTEN